MTGFIHELFKFIELSNPDQLIILPNQRALSRLKESFKKRAHRAQLLPRIMIWSDFVESLTPYRTIGRDEALVRLYLIYKGISQKYANFNSFKAWGTTVLADFEAIQLNGLKGEEVLRKSTLIESFNQWDVQVEEKKEFFSNWEILEELYTKFYKELQLKGLQTNSTKYQHANGNLPADYTKIYLAGFTVFSPAEKSLLNSLSTNSNMQIIYDLPIWEGITKNHESNLFHAELESLKAEVELIRGGQIEKNIQSYECINEVVQVKALSDLLSKLDHDEQKSTAIVLLDDDLFPVLANSMPENIRDINIGKGLALSYFPKGELLRTIFFMHAELKSTNQIKSASLMNLIQQRAMGELLSETEISSVRDRLIALNRYGYGANELGSEFPAGNWGMLINALVRSTHQVELLKMLAQNFENLEQEIQLILIQFEGVVSKIGEDLPVEVHTYMLDQVLDQPIINVTGDKESGLQILSLLETRCLDFNRVIILSFQEENLPEVQLQSILPLEIRTKYNLPDIQHKEAVLSYHFMRLLKRSEDVHLFHSSTSAGTKLGEASRFLLQAELEWSQSDYIDFHKQVISIGGKTTKIPAFKIEKSPSIIRQIEEYLFNRGLSPSALNVYLSNPMDFYLFHILGLREKEEVDYSVEASTLGTAVHNALDKIYKPFLNTDSSQVELKLSESQITILLQKELGEVYPVEVIQSGRIQLLLPAMNKWIRDFIQYDLHNRQPGSFIIKGLEEYYRVPVKIGNRTIFIKGGVDREEQWGSHYHILDYKTGKVEPRDLMLSTDDLLEFNPEKSKAYQLMLYSMMTFETNQNKERAIISSIYSFRNKKAGLIPLKIDKNMELVKDHFDSFKIGLAKIVDEMLDPNVPLELTNNRYQKFEI